MAFPDVVQTNLFELAKRPAAGLPHALCSWRSWTRGVCGHGRWCVSVLSSRRCAAACPSLLGRSVMPSSPEPRLYSTDNNNNTCHLCLDRYRPQATCHLPHLLTSGVITPAQFDGLNMLDCKVERFLKYSSFQSDALCNTTNSHKSQQELNIRDLDDSSVLQPLNHSCCCCNYDDCNQGC